MLPPIESFGEMSDPASHFQYPRSNPGMQTLEGPFVIVRKKRHLMLGFVLAGLILY